MRAVNVKRNTGQEILDSIRSIAFFKKMDEKYTEAGALLLGTRHREGWSQKELK